MMDHKTPEPDLSHQTGISRYGEFTCVENPKVRYAVTLTERELMVQRITSTPSGRNQVVHNLKDCVGCRTYRGQDDRDPAAYFSAFFYPFKKRWMSSGGARQRVELGFKVEVVQDPRINLEEAERWAKTIRDGSVRQQRLRNGVGLSEVRPPCRVMLLVNPQSGRGDALSLFTAHVQRMFHEAGITHTLVITERQNHARELVREADLSQWDALVIMSGDGLLFEVVNGLMEREDWREAIRTPLGMLPGGSGNALSASIHHYSGAQAVSSEELLVSCGFLLCKGLVSPMDLTSIQLSSNRRLFSFLSLAWGFVADVDVESEKYRHVGAARFTLGTLVRLASLRVYQGKLAYLPVEEEEEEGGEGEEEGRSVSIDVSPRSPSPSAFCPASFLCGSAHDSPAQKAAHTLHNSSNSNNSLKGKKTEAMPSHGAQTGPLDSLLVPLDQPVPGDWVVVKEEDFVLLLAIYQTHLAEDLFTAPGASLHDGIIHLFYVRAGISRTSLLRLFLAMEKGAHMAINCPHMVHAKARALRLEPWSPKGVITVDGEVVDYGPVQAQVHGGLARLITG